MPMTSQRPEAVTVPRRSPTMTGRMRLARYSAQAAVTGIVVWVIVKQFVSDGSGAEGLCPFGGFETFWTWITTNRTVKHTHPANLALAVAILVMAVAGRSFFCGWACPLGAVQGAIHAIVSTGTSRIPLLRRLRRRTTRATSSPGGWAQRLDHLANFGRFLVLAWALIGAAYYGYMVFREVDPWIALINVAEFEFNLAFVMLLLVIALSIVIRRPFCRYACPLGAVQGLIAKASPVAIQRTDTACLGCDLCNRACPMNIPVNQRTRVTDTTCIACLECITACPSRDALGIQIALPLLARPSASGPTGASPAPAAEGA